MDRSVRTLSSAADAAQRYDLYAPIHKALRAFLGETLALVGRMDPDDPHDVFATLGSVRALLEFCTKHLQHENQYVHPALEAAHRGGSLRTADDHLDHEEAIAALAEAVDEVETARGAARAAAAMRLYRQLALFVAENLEHMHVEETHNTDILWSAFDDHALMDIEHAIVGSQPPEEAMHVMRWMIPSLSHPERVAVLSGMREQAPAEAFDAVLELAQARLPQRDWAKLAKALGVPAARGLVERW